MKTTKIVKGDTLTLKVDTAGLPPGEYPISVKTAHPNGVIVADYVLLEVIEPLPLKRIKKRKKS